MSQQPIDLLPESIRLSCQAMLRTGRYIAAVVTALAIVVVLATHSRIEQDRAAERFAEARRTADLVLQTEARGADLLQQLDEHRRTIALHDSLAHPIRVSSLLATIVNRMPTSVSLDRIDLTATSRSAARAARPGTARGSQPSGETAPHVRLLSGEMSGFAASDAEIIALLEAIGNTSPFDDISLDFTRTRTVHGHTAREFRISFRVDLDSVYEEIIASAAASR